jgi:subtilisin-like proprotein convertase family protein
MAPACAWPARTCTRIIVLATVVASLAVAAPADAVQEFTNPAGITVNTSTNPRAIVAATPYPSTIDVSGGPTSIPKMTVRIFGVRHRFVRDMDVLLLSPLGEKTILMSDVGSDSAGSATSTFTFDDAAPTSLTTQTDVSFSGTYKPSNFSSTADCVGTPSDSFPLSAPQAWIDPPDLARFDGTNANGIWSLYVVDDCEGEAGSIVQWSLRFYGRFLLSVGKAGTGDGTVDSSPSGIHCGFDCGQQYIEDETVTLSATPESGSRFVGWSGGGCSGTGSCQVTVAAATQVNADFDYDDPPVAVDDTATVAHDTPPTTLDVRANDTDPEGDAISVQSVADPPHGQTSLAGGGNTVRYQPDPGYCNDPGPEPTDDFAYTLNGGSTAMVRVTVTCPDQPTAGPGPGPGSADPGVTGAGTGGGQPTGQTQPVQTQPGQAPVAPLALPTGSVPFRNGTIRLRLRCRAATRCRGSLTVKPAKSGAPRAATAGRARFDIAAGHSATVKVKPTRALLAQLRRRGRATATVVASVNGASTPTEGRVRVVRRR